MVVAWVSDDIDVAYGVFYKIICVYSSQKVCDLFFGVETIPILLGLVRVREPTGFIFLFLENLTLTLTLISISTLTPISIPP